MVILDLSFLLNLIALTLGALYTIQNGELSHDQEIIVSFSLSVALLTSVCIIIWHLMNKLHKNKKIRDKVYGVGTRLVQALKQERVVDLMMVKIGRRE